MRAGHGGESSPISPRGVGGIPAMNREWRVMNIAFLNNVSCRTPMLISSRNKAREGGNERSSSGSKLRKTPVKLILGSSAVGESGKDPGLICEPSK